MEESKLIRTIKEIWEKRKTQALEIEDKYDLYDSLTDLEYARQGETQRYKRLNNKTKKYAEILLKKFPSGSYGSFFNH